MSGSKRDVRWEIVRSWVLSYVVCGFLGTYFRLRHLSRGLGFPEDSSEIDMTSDTVFEHGAGYFVGYDASWEGLGYVVTRYGYVVIVIDSVEAHSRFGIGRLYISTEIRYRLFRDSFLRLIFGKGHEDSLEGMNDGVKMIRQRLWTVEIFSRSYADWCRWQLPFDVRNHVILGISPRWG